MKPVKRIKGTRDLPPTALLDPPKMKVEPELARLLINWALWRAGGQSIGRYYQYSALSVLRPGSPGAYQPPSMLDDHSAQVLAADASRVDRVVNAMAGDLRQALVTWWVEGGSVRQKARKLGCRTGTVYALLESAHENLRRNLMLDKSRSTEGKQGVKA